MTKPENLKQSLKEIQEFLKSSSETLKRTYEELKDFDINKYEDYKDIDWDRLKDIETLTARFARVSDIYVQKFLRIVDEIELTADGSMIDRINRAEKRELLKSADTMLAIRYLRNDISHDYLPEEIFDIYKEVFKFTPFLLEACELAINYIVYKTSDNSQ